VGPRKTVGKLRDSNPLRRLERLNRFVETLRPGGAREPSLSTANSGPFESLLSTLSRADVLYMAVEGVACALNGIVRATETLAVLVDAEPENIRRLIDALSHVGDGHARELRIEDFADEEGAVRLVEDFPIDIFTRMGGRRYADVLPHRRIHDGEVSIPFVDAEGLILLKSRSPRPQDRIDVEALRGLQDRG
jgi:hypothetical protein